MKISVARLGHRSSSCVGVARSRAQIRVTNINTICNTTWARSQVSSLKMS